MSDLFLRSPSPSSPSPLRIRSPLPDVNELHDVYIPLLDEEEQGAAAPPAAQQQDAGQRASAADTPPAGQQVEFTAAEIWGSSPGSLPLFPDWTPEEQEAMNLWFQKPNETIQSAFETAPMFFQSALAPSAPPALGEETKKRQRDPDLKEVGTKELMKQIDSHVSEMNKAAEAYQTNKNKLDKTRKGKSKERKDLPKILSAVQEAPKRYNKAVERLVEKLEELETRAHENPQKIGSWVRSVKDNVRKGLQHTQQFALDRVNWENQPYASLLSMLSSGFGGVSEWGANFLVPRSAGAGAGAGAGFPSFMSGGYVRAAHGGYYGMTLA